ncbi:transcriptional repressor LexA [Myxococcota bacterium]|nr:transcriptional repressor LexA [Myxococcota bacterium]
MLEAMDGGRKDRLTRRQRQVLEFIGAHVARTGLSPTYREIGEGLDIRSTNGVSDHVRALIRKGYLGKLDGGRGPLARALGLTERAAGLTGLAAGPAVAANAPGGDSDVVEVPIYGRVAAGSPILADQNLLGHLRVDSFLIGPSARKVFALRVSGDSMVNDGILDGDYILVQKQLQVRDGEISVVMVDGEATVKRFYHEGRRIRLQPANDHMAPIYVDATAFRDVNVLGVVVGVYRKLN